ncbi:hypothetical protein GCM10025770_29150 [Viridibacterium curvum]|uniref:Uncharacterized protein n=2 Tax=Viridibacterium curvum TaxID=1101404 RepID=A0ABP9QXL0_9RHOO
MASSSAAASASSAASSSQSTSSSQASSASSASSATSSSATSSAPSAACDALENRLRATTLTVSGKAAVNDEYTPAIITPRANGSSLLAWTDSTAKTIRLANLASNDTLGSNLPNLTGLEVHAGLAIGDAVALAVVDNDPDIYSSKYCQGASTPSNNVCGKMDLVRLDGSGNTLTRTTLTKKNNVDSVGAIFTWWYAHTARLATDGSRIGVYFRSAGSYERPGVAGEVDIHAGDTLRFVDASTGALQSGGWEWGCSHSWSVRLGYNGSRWGAACHGDAYPNALQVARLSSPTAASSNLQWQGSTDATQRALGGLVPASDGFWINYVQPGNSLQLAKVPNSGTALTQQVSISAATGMDATYPFRPYMAAYGSDKLLLGWKASGKLVLAVASATTGAVLEGPVTTNLNIDRFQDMVTAPNGDVVWAYSRGDTRIDVNRVASCKLAN